jgi:cell filamentation protein
LQIFGLIETYLGNQLRGIARENFLRQLLPDAFVMRLAHYMGEINAAHPFREGKVNHQCLAASE